MARFNVIFLLLSIICGILAKDRVPVLIWNPNQVQDNIAAVPALQTVDYATLQSKYLSKFEPKNILLFLQDALSVEDLSSHASEFQALSEWMKEGHSLYLPNVEDPSHLTHDLAAHGYNVVSLEPGVPAAGLDLKQQDKNLVVVKLPSTLTHPIRSRALQKTVEVMQNVISKIGAKRDFTFIFTGIKPSVEDTSAMYESRVRVPRAAVMPREGNHTHSYECVTMRFMSNLTLTFNDKPLLDIDDSLASTDTGHCDTQGNERKASLQLKFLDGIEPYNKAFFTFNFIVMASSWEFTDAVVLLDKDETALKLMSASIKGIPIGMSYTCGDQIVLANNETSGKNMKLTIRGIQMEASMGNITNKRFGPTWDCVGFFTVPIWVSLLTTLLLLVILTTGLYMLSDIKTMDRFDDPKGQPIMVPSTD